MGNVPRIRNSVFNAQWLEEHIESRWRCKGVECKYWSRAVNDTYLVTSSRRRAYLRVSRLNWRTPVELQAEVELLRYLLRHGVRVARPLPKRDGSFLDRFDTPEGRRFGILFSDAGPAPATDARSRWEFGRLVAEVHQIADGRRERFRRFDLDLDHLVRNPLQSIDPFLSNLGRHRTHLRRVAEDLADAVALLLPTSAPEYGMCHGDLHSANVHRDGDGRSTLFDFDGCGYGWRAYDLAVFLWSSGWGFDRGGKTRRTRRWNEFLDGYHSVRSLTDAELEAVKLFVPIRHIWLMGLHAELQPELGKRTLSEKFFRTHVGLIKQWLEHYQPL